MRIGFAALAAVGLVLTGCSAGDPGETQPTESGDEIVVWATDDRITALQETAAKFTEDTGTKVVFVEKSYEDLRDDFMTQVPTGEGPDVMASAGGDWVNQFAENGVAAPIELGEKTAAFTPAALASFTVNGQPYGVPSSTENIGLVRNTALAPDAPTSWDDMMETGKALVAEGKAKYPIIIQQDPTVGDPYHLYPLQSSFGSHVFGTDADGAYVESDLSLGGAEGEAFATFLGELGSEGIIRSTISYDIAMEAFQNGESPFIITGPWATPGFTEAGLDVAVGPIPSAGGEVSQVFLDVQGWVVSAKSDNPLSANNFVVNYIGDKDVQISIFQAGGRPPALIEALEDPIVADDPIVSGFAEAGENGEPGPSFPWMETVWSDWGAAQIAIIEGKGDPVEIWDTMVTNLKEKIG